ncbi:MAG: nucleotidyltransferase domain-containing protein [Candidatus Hydrogenedentota bacterium]
MKDTAFDGIREVLVKYPEILFALVFGSYARKEALILDIDIAVYLKNNNYCKNIILTDAISDELKKILLIKPDVVVLNEAPLSFQLQVITESILVYCVNDDIYTDYLEDLSRKSIETMYFRAQEIEDLERVLKI